VPFPSAEVKLSDLDWRILGSLSRHPWKPYVSISREIGRSPRTVRRRLERLSGQGALFAFPALDPKAVKRSVMAGILVTYAPERKERIDAEICRRLDPYLWHVFHMLPLAPSFAAPCVFNVMLPNAAVAPDIKRWVQRLGGVKAVRCELYEEIITMYEPLDALMKKGRIGGDIGGG
jgi:hypothetical protein